MTKGILALPDDIIKNVTKDNWETLYDEYMIHENEYMWDIHIMKAFIKKLVGK